MVPFSFHVTISPRLPGNPVQVVLFSVRKNVSYAYWLPSEHVRTSMRMYVQTYHSFIHSIKDVLMPHFSISLSLSLVSSEQCRHFLMDDDDDGGRNTPSKGGKGAKGVVAFTGLGHCTLGGRFALRLRDSCNQAPDTDQYGKDHTT